MAESGIKARSRITPDSFAVAPELIGLPLAKPSRRALAMLIDVILISIVVRVGSGVLLGLAAVVLLLRISAPSVEEGLVRRWVRNALRVAAAVILFITIGWGWDNFRESAQEDADDDPETEVAASGINLDDWNLGVMGTARVATAVMALRNERDSAAAASRVREIADEIGELGVDQRNQLRDGMLELADENNNPVARGAVIDVFGASSATADEQRIDSLARVLLSADDDTTEARAAAREALERALAGEDIARLERRVNRLEESNQALRQQADERNRGRGMLSILRGLADDLGLGFGWSAVYFTAFLALGRGRTVGKRMMKTRVIRLDGKPIGWWVAFERFGGYAASITLGLLGFAQILWDRNRQGIHDKIVETVVIQETAAAPAARPPLRSAPPPRP